MANKPILSGSLLIKTPQQSSMNTSTKTQAFAGMFMNVAVEQIDFFDKNPRKRHDPEIYEQIKASIRASGVQQPVHITQRPNSDRYVLAQGGNTRLSIVKELYAETNDKRFAFLPCIFVEYTDEQSIQIAHLIENEQRQEMCFWDKAQAYAEIRDVFQNNVGKDISNREMTTVFASHGLSISRPLLTLLFFANDTLKPLGRLSETLSIPKTNKIIKTHNDLKKQCKDACKDEQEFRNWFVIALRDFANISDDKTELNADKLIEHLHTSFNNCFEIQAEPLFDNEESFSQTEIPEKISGSLNNVERQPESLPENVSGNLKDIQSTKTVEKIGAEQIDNGNKTSETVNFATIEDWQNAIHAKARQLLEMVCLHKSFRLSDLFPLGFYVEYPDFELLKTIILERRQGAYVIDYQHKDAGDIWSMLSILSGQNYWMFDFDSISNNKNPILKLDDKSQLKKSIIDADFGDKVKYDYTGDHRYFLPEKLITWLGDTSSDNKIANIVQALFRTIQAKPFIGDDE